MLLRQAVTRLIAAPLFTVFAVVSLGAGVAVTTAVYSVVDSLFLADFGIDDPDRVALVMTAGSGRTGRGLISDPDFEDLRAAQTAFSHLAASASIDLSVASSTNAEMLAAEAVDGAYFGTVGVSARLGRVILPPDHEKTARVAVLSDALWRGRFAADTAIVGRTIRIAGHVFEIIGVAPARYRGAYGRTRTTSLWIPLASEALLNAKPFAAARGRGRLMVIGRLGPDRTVEAATAELGTIARRLDADYPVRQADGRTSMRQRAWVANSITAVNQEDSGEWRFGLTLIVLVGLVLAVACTNLANLVLARGTARQGELAVRMAMGASRGRLVWEQCVESGILAVLGAIASYVVFLGVSAMMTRDFTIVIPPMGRLTLAIRPELNAQALGVAATSMLLALVVFGLEPAVQLARTLDIRSALAAGATGVRPRVGRQRLVIRWQVAVAAGFFIVATMFIRATLDQARHDPGVEMDRIAVATLNFDAALWDEARIRRTVERVLEEGQRAPSIETMAASTGLPFGVHPALQVAVARPEGDFASALARTRMAAIAVTPSLFRTLGVAIVQGRGFNDSDNAGGAPAVILSEMTAKQMFGSGDAVGQAVALRRAPHGDQMATVIGIARDTDVGFVYSNRRPLVYLPLAQHFDGFITIAARSTGGSAAAVPALREAIRRADPDLGVDVIGGGRALLSGPFEIVRSGGMGTLYLGAFTLLLSMVGLFGVQSHVVAYRTREIGVRMSVGATAAQIKMMVMRDGYRPVLEGLVLGLWGGLAARFVVRAYLDLEVTIFDPWMLLVTPIPLVMAAFCACYLPAARASRVDPTVALRCE